MPKKGMQKMRWQYPVRVSRTGSDRFANCSICKKPIEKGQRYYDAGEKYSTHEQCANLVRDDAIKYRLVDQHVRTWVWADSGKEYKGDEC